MSDSTRYVRKQNAIVKHGGGGTLARKMYKGMDMGNDNDMQTAK